MIAHDVEQLDLFAGLEGTTPELERAFLDFHRANPRVWKLFDRFAHEAIARLPHCGVALIWERMRWHAAVETTGKPFKLNNNHRAYYARLWMAKHPDRAGFFRTREVRT